MWILTLISHPISIKQQCPRILKFILKMQLMIFAFLAYLHFCITCLLALLTLLALLAFLCITLSIEYLKTVN